MQVWNHDTILTTGKYAGRKLCDVPAHWFIFMFDIFGVDKRSPLGIYLKDNIEQIRVRAKSEEKDRKRQDKLNRK